VPSSQVELLGDAATGVAADPVLKDPEFGVVDENDIEIGPTSVVEEDSGRVQPPGPCRLKAARKSASKEVAAGVFPYFWEAEEPGSWLGAFL
jgi:hypothetical protein